MRVYLAGPIQNVSDNEAIGWREVATKKLRYAGFEAVCPIKDGVDVPSGTKMTNWLATKIFHTDLKLIKTSDALLVNFPSRSEGTAMEILYAYQLRKPVVVFNYTSRSAFMDATVTAYCLTMVQAITALKLIHKSLILPKEVEERRHLRVVPTSK